MHPFIQGYREVYHDGWLFEAKRTRAEEMEEAKRLLKEPKDDGDRVLLLAQEVTVVTGQHRTSIFMIRGAPAE